MKKSALAIILGATLFATSAFAHQAGDVIIRAGAVTVNANSKSTAKPKPSLELKVKNNTQLGLTATYMTTDNIGVELLGATPFSHKITAKVGALDLDLDRVAKVKQLPPSLYVQYYVGEKDWAARPYVGVGLNYTRFYNAKSLNSAVTNLKVKKHSVGPVANLGVDVKLTDKLYFNAAAWYTRIKTTATFDALGGSHEVKLKLSPVVYFAGFAYKF